MKSDKNIREGYKKSAVGVIPEEWEVKKLGDIGETLNGLSGKTKKDFGEGYPYVTYLNIFNHKKIDNTTQFDYVNISKTEKQNQLKYGDLLFTTSSETPHEVGMSSVILLEPVEELYLNSFCFGLRLKKLNAFKPEFLSFLLRGSYFRKKMTVLAQGSTRFNLSKANFIKTKLPIPPLPEQQAIANCLTTWDSGIEKLTQLIAAKREQKKGLMQQLLTGKKRLDGFVGEWKEVKLGRLGETFNGLTGKTKIDFGEGKPYVTYLNTFRQNKIDKNTCFDYVKIKDNEKQSTLKYGDLIFTTSSETPNEVGMSSVVLFHPENKLYLNSFCFGLRLKDFDLLNPSFAVFLLRSADFRREMYKLAQGSTRFNLSKSSFKKTKLKVPPIAEQTAIAHILTTADQEISLLEAKLAAMKEEKKGLMQVLLTGQKRLIDS